MPFACLRTCARSHWFCTRSSMPASTPNAFCSRNAISALREAFPLTTSESVARLTPSIIAASVSEISSGSNMPNQTTSPGCDGSFIGPSVSVVVFEVDAMDSFSCDTKGQPPIARDCHAPNTFASAFQLMQTPSRNGRKGTHIGSGRQKRQRRSYPFDLIGWQATRLVMIQSRSSALWPMEAMSTLYRTVLPYDSQLGGIKSLRFLDPRPIRHAVAEPGKLALGVVARGLLGSGLGLVERHDAGACGQQLAPPQNFCGGQRRINPRQRFRF